MATAMPTTGVTTTATTTIATTQRASYASVVKGALTPPPLSTLSKGPVRSAQQTYVSVAKQANVVLSLPIPVAVPRIVFRRRRRAPRGQPVPAPAPVPEPTPAPAPKPAPAHKHAQRSSLDPRAPPFYPTPARGSTRPSTPFNPLAPVFTPRGPTPTPTPAPNTATATTTRIIAAAPWIPTGSHSLFRCSPDASDSAASTRSSSPLSAAAAAAAAASSWFASPWSASPRAVSSWTTPPSAGTSLGGYSLAGSAVAGGLLMALLRSGSEPVEEGPLEDFGPVGGPVRRERAAACKDERKRLVGFIKERTARRIERLWG